MSNLQQMLKEEKEAKAVKKDVFFNYSDKELGIEDQLLGTVSSKAETSDETVTKKSLEEILADDVKRAELKAQIERLEQGKDGIKVVHTDGAKKIQIDYSKLSEKDIYDFAIPMEAIELSLPNEMDVELLDKNYAPRWVNVHPARLGQLKSAGFTAVTEQDLAKPLNIICEKDINGMMKHIDVVLMKIEKSRLWPAIRRNHLRSVVLTDPNKLHELQRARLNDYMLSLEPHEVAMWIYAQQNDSTGQSKMSAFIP
jgi:hypothetical protein